MKIPIILLLFVIFFGTYLFADANAGSAVSNVWSLKLDSSITQVHLQLVLRNSEGQLVSYFQSDDLRLIYPERTHQFLDAIDNKIRFEQDGRILERIQWQKTEYFDYIAQPNIYALIEQTGIDILMYHGPYLTEPGDSLTIYWDIIRVPS